MPIFLYRPKQQKGHAPDDKEADGDAHDVNADAQGIEDTVDAVHGAGLSAKWNDTALLDHVVTSDSLFVFCPGLFLLDRPAVLSGYILTENELKCDT